MTKPTPAYTQLMLKAGLLVSYVSEHYSTRFEGFQSIGENLIISFLISLCSRKYGLISPPSGNLLGIGSHFPLRHFGLGELRTHLEFYITSLGLVITIGYFLEYYILSDQNSQPIQSTGIFLQQDQKLTIIIII